MKILRKLMHVLLLVGMVGCFINFWIFLWIGLINDDIYWLTRANTNMILFGLLFYIEDRLLK